VPSHWSGGGVSDGMTHVPAAVAARRSIVAGPGGRNPAKFTIATPSQSYQLAEFIAILYPNTVPVKPVIFNVPDMESFDTIPPTYPSYPGSSHLPD